MATLQNYRDRIDAECCPYCKTALSPVTWFKPHRFGFHVNGFDPFLWLWLVCTGCGQVVSFEKLGLWPVKEW